MYNYIIKNLERLETEIDNILSFQNQKNLLKHTLFTKIIEDAKENVGQITPENLFDPQRYGVWFHSKSYPAFASNTARYDTYVGYFCQLADNRRDVLITLE
ncbi:hypothetical protein [Enterococcus sp. DIV0187]|uniref:hypothetical protein n=1 Tax=Enterococcus sp. DIV0187 TaxID=2774644 RepID=UPI003F27EC21